MESGSAHIPRPAMTCTCLHITRYAHESRLHQRYTGTITLFLHSLQSPNKRLITSFWCSYTQVPTRSCIPPWFAHGLVSLHSMHVFLHADLKFLREFPCWTACHWCFFLFSDFLFKFLVIGSAGTGKSCLLHQFIESKCKYSQSFTNYYVKIIL